MATTDVLEFQAEAKELLGLMIHSLYTSRDVFLRELISNASDALDRLRTEALTNHDLLRGDERFEIRIEIDPAARTISVSDTGIGMSRDEVIENIGTIARSGTRELRARLRAAGDQGPALIGQFGVGFYSVFMSADRVRLVTRRAGETTATAWESDGLGTFTVADAERAQCGTTVTLHVKAPDAANGIDDYTASWWVVGMVKKYSDFVPYPIIMRDPEPTPDTGAAPERTLNSMKPLWKRAPAEVTDAEHAGCFRQITHDWNEPLKSIHLRAEGTIEYEAVLYVPKTAPPDLYYVSAASGLRLYANRVLVMDACPDLLPHYLRFVKGVVDVGDVPLNISRQRLQQDHHLEAIRKKLTRKVLAVLAELRDGDRDRYAAVWREFGRALREGIAADWDSRDRIIPLMLFESSALGDALTTLDEYIARMKPGQTEIFYLTGESRGAVQHSPHLESLREHGYEVLYLTEGVDELWLQYVREHQGKLLKSAGKGLIAVGTDEEQRAAADRLAGQEETYRPLLDALQQVVAAHVRQVRLSARLTTSPVCLVVEDHEESPLMERVLQRGTVARRRILEINPAHPLIVRLCERAAASADDPAVAEAAEALLGMARLLEGSGVPDPVALNRAVLSLAARAL